MRASAKILLVLFALTAAFSLTRTPYGEAFGFSDHFSHMNAARIFPRIGTELWRRPLNSIFSARDPALAATAPADIRAAGAQLEVPGWPVDKPLVVSWGHIARPYPPGVFLLLAPIAALYHFTGISFDTAVHALIVLFLACAHLFFFQVLRDLPKEGRRVYLAAALVAYAYVVFWTLRGFYDMAAAVPLMAAAHALGERKWRTAGVAFAIAFFLHYRALFYLPWGVVALVAAIRARDWRSWRGFDGLAVLVAVALAAASLYTFMLVSPSLSAFPAENPIHPGQLKIAPVVAFAASVVAAAAIFVRTRSFLDLAMLAWISLMLVSVRQVQSWHTFLLLPWVFAAVPSPVLTRVGRIAFVATVTLAVFL